MTEFVYTIKSHPTSYKGVNFRSRLEATWAAFFETCGIRCEYEPFDLDGWTPDFLIHSTRSVLVEVKPLLFGTSGWREDIEMARDAAGKVGSNEALILGVSPFLTPVRWSEPRKEKQCQIGVFLGKTPGYAYITEGQKVHHECIDDPSVRVDYTKFWKIAKNRTQWKPA